MRMTRWHTLLMTALLPLAACVQSAEPPAASKAAATAKPTAAAKVDPAKAAPIAASSLEEMRQLLATKIPGAKPEDLRTTPIPGIFELTHGTDVTYVSADAKFIFAGDLYQVANQGQFPNLTETRRRELRLARVNQVPESEMVVFGPANAPHTLTVFTDVDCSWCRRLHGQIEEYNKLGVRVRYLAFPRSGPDTPSWARADAVWCAKDRNKLLGDAKQGEEVSTGAKACAQSPVAKHFELGRELGVTGTPGLVLETGELIPGYLTPQQLVSHLQQEKNAAQAAATTK